ncbi:Putative periplasmic protein [Helicobacter mustelae 12198]|uniref:Putative periplasmic protein n=1 Tax=Helicobacter mustelae (strain ATCC 43772 / CCUG 25715 / CIP 103759 / LMG 18044 / NCTC 12198 / R85-136P) TaxID=679897 RepID=D3UFS9_HELM1|nr:Putative periplasmic protein [Helicobacter mustelae 12198]
MFRNFTRHCLGILLTAATEKPLLDAPQELRFRTRVFAAVHPRKTKNIQKQKLKNKKKKT